MLMDPKGEIWRTPRNGVVLWTLPEGVSSGFMRLTRGEMVDNEELIRDVKVFCEAVRAIPKEVSTIFVTNWAPGAFEGRLGLMDFDANRGISLALMRMNLALVENLGGDSRVFVLDAARWMLVYGQKSLSSRLWYMAKTPYSFEFLKLAAQEIKASLRAVRGEARKLLILDLDDTLWGGAVGDLGWKKVSLGGHDPSGEAFYDFQVALRSLKRRGVLLAISSKNEERVALEAIDANPEMVLRKADFVVGGLTGVIKLKTLPSLPLN